MIKYPWRKLVVAIALGALASATTDGASLARTDHRSAKTSAATQKAKPANIPEKNRDPADIALDRKIKGICRGC